MPAVTYLRDHEVRAWASVPSDKDLNDLLQELRTLTKENWLIQRREIETRHASFWKRIFCKPPANHVQWTMYADCRGEWQVMSFATANGSSIFNACAHERENIINFMLGYIGGYRRATPPHERKEMGE